jgi:chemotaxis protein MotC
VLLLIARDALVKGRFEQARRAAEEVARLPGADQATIARASLYKAAARIAVDRAEGALDTLKRIDTNRLPAAEQEIHRTALRIASQIVDGTASANATPASAEPPDLDPGVKRLVAAAQRSLGQARALLGPPGQEQAKP